MCEIIHRHYHSTIKALKSAKPCLWAGSEYIVTSLQNASSILKGNQGPNILVK